MIRVCCAIVVCGEVLLSSFLNGPGLVLGAGRASAQPYDCARPQDTCAAEIAPICLERLGAGVIATEAGGAQSEGAAACSAQLTRYRECLSWIVQHCDNGRAADASDALGGTMIVQGDVVQGDKLETIIQQNIEVLMPGATSENPASAVRQHCFIWDNKKMCEPY